MSVGLSGFIVGVILVVFKMSGYVSVIIILVSKCVRCGESRGVSFFTTFIVIMSLPTELEALAFFIILLMSLIVGSGSVNLVFFLGIKYCSICKGVMLLFVVNFDLMLYILSVKWLFSMFVICLSLVMTLFFI